MAEHFSRIGVPVFIADVKGDLSGIEFPGSASGKIMERISNMNLSNFQFEGNPVRYWDPYGEEGDAVKTTLERLGKDLIGQLLNLSDAQFGSLYQTFKIASDFKIKINNLRGLYGVINVILERSDDFEGTYGRIAKMSYTSLQRSLLMLEDNGEDSLFSTTGESFDIKRFLEVRDGRGVINILRATRLIKSQKVYATFLLWLLKELFEVLPECGDSAKPLIAFFFDEAHLIFDGAPRVLTEQVEKLVRLIRSKGVGVYFITQKPSDIPEDVLSQLSNRIQHSMRSYTPKEQQSIRSIAQSFRVNKSLNVEKIIGELKIGEALVSFLDEHGAPREVDRALICPPHSRIGA